jgi:hypothetical protein
MTELRDIWASDRLSDRFWQLLESDHPQDRLYVYRVDLDHPKAPKQPIYKGNPFPDLPEFLRDEHGGGDFQVLFRRGSMMLLAGVIGIASPPGGKRPGRAATFTPSL